MVKEKVVFYPTDWECHNALALYILENVVVDARAATFTEDKTLREFQFVNMKEREWYGVMCGYRLISDKGEKVIFASWEDEPVVIPEQSSTNVMTRDDSDFDKDIDSAYSAFMHCLTMYN